jgi:protein-L-isoaspartate(D-aspartate) O-methyltransferase
MRESYEESRKRMVADQIQRRGVSDLRVLEAFLKVPRHKFVPEELRKDAYRDCPLPIGQGQTISQPYMVATMTALASVGKGDRVLEIGTGSGYQAAILAELAGQVFSVERHEVLSKTAKATLDQLGYRNVQFKVGDGTLGWVAESPFSAIVVTAGAPDVPEPLIEQLLIGGKLVIPIEAGFAQVLHTIKRTSSGIEKLKGERCTFVPLVGKHGWES